MRVKWLSSLEELNWVNSEYEKIGFLPSKWEKDKVAIALDNNQIAGMGRFVPLENGDYELGGIYVLPEFRNRGIARDIVSFLMKNAPAYRKIYCLPFEHLKAFYQEFGFKVAGPGVAMPREIEEKHSWCLDTYTHDVLVMIVESV